jgi:hypothetical protein
MKPKKIIDLIETAKKAGMTRIIIFNPDDIVIPPYIQDRSMIIDVE